MPWPDDDDDVEDPVGEEGLKELTDADLSWEERSGRVKNRGLLCLFRTHSSIIFKICELLLQGATIVNPLQP